MKPINEAAVTFLSRSANEGFARTTAACFAAQMDPTLDEVNDIKTAVSEAVTNAIVHAYPDSLGRVGMRLRLFEDNTLEIVVKDWGVGIEDVEKARQPLFTTGSEERSGMGFTIMESFMDGVKVRSRLGKGTTVTLRRRLSRRLGTSVGAWRTPPVCWRRPAGGTTRPVPGSSRRTRGSSGASCAATMAGGRSRRTCTSWDAWAF